MQNHAENEAGIVVPDFFLLFEKTLLGVKADGLELSFSKF